MQIKQILSFLQHPVTILVTDFTNPDNLTNDLLILTSLIINSSICLFTCLSLIIWYLNQRILLDSIENRLWISSVKLKTHSDMHFDPKWRISTLLFELNIDLSKCQSRAKSAIIKFNIEGQNEALKLDKCYHLKITYQIKFGIFSNIDISHNDVQIRQWSIRPW